jgi:hypothetical protein
MLYLSEEDRRELAFWERIPISNRESKISRNFVTSPKIHNDYFNITKILSLASQGWLEKKVNL